MKPPPLVDLRFFVVTSARAPLPVVPEPEPVVLRPCGCSDAKLFKRMAAAEASGDVDPELMAELKQRYGR
jgi:hypothetical protein